MLFLTESDVRRLLPMAHALSLVRGAFRKLAAGVAVNNPRRRLRLEGGTLLHYMAAGDESYFGAKLYSTRPGQPPRFLFLLYRTGDAQLVALMEANYLGQIRTGAASGIATDVMAPPDAGVLGIIGSGFQARTQIEAIASVRRLREVRVWSRSGANREALVSECKAAGIPARAAVSAEQAVRDADLLVTITSSRTPVLDAAWVSPGAHINAAGVNWPDRRELPGELVRKAGLIAVDSLEAAQLESGDLLLALKDLSGVVELSSLVAQPRPRRPEDISIFKSNGLAIEDVAVAGDVFEKALQEHCGQQIPAYDNYS